MEVIRDLADIRPRQRGGVCTIGSFDGIHRGHRVLFQQVVEQAERHTGPATVLSFTPHPVTVLRPGVRFTRLTSDEDRLRLIGECGIEAVVLLPFTPSLVETSARDFFRQIFVEALGLAHLVVGWDFTFGHNREGNAAMLRTLCEEVGMGLSIVEPVVSADAPASSTRIRRLLHEGDVDGAAVLLERYHSVMGTTQHGEKIGRTLGFRTINTLVGDLAVPGFGVYFTLTDLLGRRYPSITNIGVRPTFDGTHPLLETHLLDSEVEAYGEPYRVHFLGRWREERRFPSAAELHAQIAEDVQAARLYHREAPRHPVWPKLA